MTIATWLLLLGIAIAATLYLGAALRRTAGKLSATESELSTLKGRFKSVVDADGEAKRILEQSAAERARLEADLQTRRAAFDRDLESRRHIADKALDEIETARHMARRELDQLNARLEQLRVDVAVLDEQSNLQSFGFYRPHYDFASSDGYSAELDRIREMQKAMLKSNARDKAAYCKIEWTVDGSAAKGKQQTNQTLRLMLRAFNGECDAAIGKVRYNNVKVMEARIDRAFEVINGLAAVQQCFIAQEYRKLKLKELYLVHEFQEKVQAEKDEQRRIREQMRDEEQARKELERAQQDAEREERRYSEALTKARLEVEKAQGAKQANLLEKIGDLEARLAVAQQQKERAIARAQLTRSGHVYIISNVGSFGEHVYKIGMTRRLDPMDRIRELGDASVPFSFDVHAVIYSEDAPGLEAKLHRAFAEHRVNMVNERKEFFGVHIDDVVRVVRESHGDILITKAAEAQEYRKTLAMLAESGRDRPVWGGYDRRSGNRTPDEVSVA